MRYLLLVLLNIAFCVAPHAQFTVLKCNGIVTCNADTLKTGSQITDESMLAFENQNAQLYLANDTLGYYTTEALELNITLSLCRLPLNTKHRGFKRKAQAVKNLKIYFGTQQFTVIGDSLAIPLDISIYPLNSEKFIVFQYKINAERQAKKIAFDAQHLILQKQALFAGKTQQQTGNKLNAINIYSFVPATKKSEKITQTDLEFVDENELIAQLQLLQQLAHKNQLLPETTNKKLDEYIYGVYGTTDPKQLQSVQDAIRP